MEVKVVKKDFLSDDPDIRHRALNIKTIKSAEKLKFTMKSKPASAKPKTAPGRPSLDVIHPVAITPRPPLSPPLTEEEKRKALNNVSEVLSMFDRSLRYEVIEEAELVQLHIIDNRDGTVVRKIPTDVVVEFIMTLKEKVDGAESEPEPAAPPPPIELEGLDLKA